jgi:hypothetical protein
MVSIYMRIAIIGSVDIDSPQSILRASDDLPAIYIMLKVVVSMKYAAAHIDRLIPMNLE